MRTTYRLLPLLLIAVLVLGGCSGRQGRRNRTTALATPGAVPTTSAHQASVQPTLIISGIIAPLQNVSITSSLAEPTLQVPVNEGDRVRAGQTLAVLDTTDLRAQLDAQERTAASADAKVTQTRYQATLAIDQSPDQVANAREALTQAQQNLSQAETDLKRDQQLVVQGYLAQQAYQQQVTLVQNDQAAVRSAQATLASAVTTQNVNGNQQQGLQAANIASSQADAASAHAAAEQIQAQIAKAVIVSPVNGVVVNRNLNPGEYPGSRTLFVVQELDNVYAELNASSGDVFRVAPSSTVSLAIPGDNSRTYRGRVAAVLGQVQPGSTNFTVKVLVVNADGKLAAGLPVTGTIALPRTTGIGIPVTAFLDDSHATVMTDKDGVAQVAHVRELASDGTTSIVRGLAAGQPIVSNGQLGLTAGAQIGALPGSPAAESSPGSAGPGR